MFDAGNIRETLLVPVQVQLTFRD